MGAAANITSSMLGLYAHAQRMAGQQSEVDYATATLEKNAQAAGVAAGEALERGTATQLQSKLQYSAQRGEQLAAQAASGMTVGVGSHLATLASTEAMSQYDAETIRTAAAREAWGYKTQAEQLRDQARLTKMRGDQEMTGEELSTVGDLMSSAGGMYGQGASMLKIRRGG